MTNREMLEMLCRDVGEMKGSMHNLEIRLDSLEKKVDNLEVRLDSLEKKVDNLETRLDGLENKFNELEDKVDRLADEVRGLSKRVDNLEIRVGALDEEVKSMNLTLENEVRRNIMTIAEGHMNLDMKLDEALKVNQKDEMTILRVNVLESDMRIVKNRLGITA